MTYSIKRFSFFGESSSKVIREETINGDTKGVVEVSRGKYQDGHKPKVKNLKIKYHVGS